MAGCGARSDSTSPAKPGILIDSESSGRVLPAFKMAKGAPLDVQALASLNAEYTCAEAASALLGTCSI